MHIRGRVPNLETPIECAKKLRSKVMKYAFTKVRAAYGRHSVTLYTRASRGLHEGFTRVSTVEAAQANEFGV